MSTHSAIAVAVLIAVCPWDANRPLALQPPATVEHLGDYAQLRETGEHVYGYVLQLWKDGSEIVGLWSIASGKPADFPTVRVDDLRWDVASGAVRFTVKACSTSRFEGVARGSEFAGRIADRRTNTATDVRLRRSEDERQSLGRAEWLGQTDSILTRRRPRCWRYRRSGVTTIATRPTSTARPPSSSRYCSQAIRTRSRREVPGRGNDVSGTRRGGMAVLPAPELDTEA